MFGLKLSERPRIAIAACTAAIDRATAVIFDRIARRLIHAAHHPNMRPLILAGWFLILPFMKNEIVSVSPEVMGGTPVFAGTRVPVQTLIEYLEGGESIEDFLEGFPTVTREQVIAFLEAALKAMLAQVKYDEIAA